MAARSVMRHLDAAVNCAGLCLFGDVARAPDRCTAGPMKRWRETTMALRPCAGAPFSQCLAQGETGGHAVRERHSHNAVAEGEIKAVGMGSGHFPGPAVTTQLPLCLDT